MVQRSRLILVVGLVAANSSCLHSWGIRPEYKPVRAVVINHFNETMEIYVAAAGALYRIGIVHPGLTDDFEIPRSMIGKGPLELLAHPNADTRSVARSGELMIGSGQVVDFVITAQLFNSTATIRQ